MTAAPARRRRLRALVGLGLRLVFVAALIGLAFDLGRRVYAGQVFTLELALFSATVLFGWVSRYAGCWCFWGEGR